MAEYLATEQQVKDALMVDSFQNLSQDQITEFISMIPNMDKEVAVAIMSQFSTYTESATSMLAQLNILCDRSLKSNDSSQMETISAYRKILDDLSERLKKEDLTFEEKRTITRDMIDIADRISEKDTENKDLLKNILKGVAITLGIVGIGLFGLAAAFSSESIDVPRGSSKDDNVDDDSYIDI